MLTEQIVRRGRSVPGDTKEIQQLCQDALEDAVLMGCDEGQFRQVLANLVETVENPYKG